MSMTKQLMKHLHVTRREIRKRITKLEIEHKRTFRRIQAIGLRYKMRYYK